MARVRLRRADDCDCDFVLACRNDPESVKNSLSQRAVTQDEHRAWFHDGQARGARYVFIAEKTMGANLPIGTCNVEPYGGDAMRISIALAPEWRGHGYGRAVIDALVGYAKERWQTKRLVANILRENVASQIAFRKAGFRPVEEVETVEIR